MDYVLIMKRGSTCRGRQSSPGGLLTSNSLLRRAQPSSRLCNLNQAARVANRVPARSAQSGSISYEQVLATCPLESLHPLDPFTHV